jgi:hypothetical protein
MRSIISYRDMAAGARPTAPWRQDKGIASIGELLWVNPGGGASATDMLRYGGDTTDEINSTVDLYPMPEDISTNSAKAQSAKDGPEEALARFQFLSQTLSTRSDLYAAYIYVRGYNASTGAPTNPGTNAANPPVTSRRWIVIFDRSKVTKASDSVRILGTYQY